MNKLEFWIKDGCLVSQPEKPVDASGVRSNVEIGALVKVETSEAGTSARWAMHAANWSSLFFLQSWLPSLPAPYVLRFFNAGWFCETFDAPKDAVARIGQLIGKADVRFSSRAFARSFVPNVAALPPRLRSAWEAGVAQPDASVVCSVDPVTGLSQVESVGHASAIASIWGVSPVTYPCLTGHSYDRVVSHAYHEVLRTRRPNFSHVIAAMTQPDGEVQWYGYQRLVFPGGLNDSGLPTVNVVGHVSEVDIPLL